MAASQQEALDRFEQARSTYVPKIRTFARRQARLRILPATDQCDIENDMLEVLFLCCLAYDPNAGATFNTYFWTAAENAIKDAHKAASRMKRAGDYLRVSLDSDDVKEFVHENFLSASAEEEALARFDVIQVFRSGRRMR